MLKTAFLLVGLSAAVFAQDVRTEFLNEVAALEKKYQALAEAFPEDKFTYRLAPGVRSVSEVFMHIALANYNLPRNVNVTPPEGMTREMEKSVTGKAQVLDHLAKSFQHLRQAADAAKEPDKMVKVFGQERSQRYFLFFLAGHMHEHLGQLIAYARTAGVKPPWAQS